MSVSVLRVIDVQPANDEGRLDLGVRQDAPWHGFRLASSNDAPLAFVAARPTVADHEVTQTREPGADGSLAWAGRLACWASALFTATLIILSVS